MSFRMILIIGGIVTLGIIALALTATPAQPSASDTQLTPADGSQDQSGKTQDQGASSDKASDDTGETVVKLPADFRRFTSKQYGFTVAFPEAWGSLVTKPNTNNSLLQAETAAARYPLGSAEASGQFLVGVYPANKFIVGIRPGNPLVVPEEKDGKVTWKVTSAAATDTYRVGNAYPVKTVTTASGLTVYDFSWLLSGKRQTRWAYKSGDNYVLMTVPPLTRSDGREPTGADLSFYANFAESIRDTAGVPK